MKIPYVNLGLQWKKEKKNLLQVIEKVLKSGNYVDPDASTPGTFLNSG